MGTDIKCPECFQVISKEVDLCPFCRHPASSGKNLMKPLPFRLCSLLKQRCQESFEQAQLHFPGIRLELGVYCDKIESVVRRYALLPLESHDFDESKALEASRDLMDKVRWEELYLTTACAEGSGPAWEIFHQRYRECILKAAFHCADSTSAAHELADSMMTDLFLPANSDSVSGPGKIGQYHGIGSLEGWLRTIVTRSRIDQIRATQRLVSLSDMETEPPDLSSSPNRVEPVLEGEQQRLLAAFTRSLASALDQLDPEERLLLNLYYLQEVKLKDLGQLLGVHESTASRRVDQIRKKLQKRVEKQLRESLHLRRSEIGMVIEEALKWGETDIRQLLTKNAQ